MSDPLTNELRKVMTTLAIEASRHRGLNDEGMAVAYCLCLYNFAAYGGNCGLITDDEVNDWIGVSRWQKDLPAVMERWNGPTQSEVR